MAQPKPPKTVAPPLSEGEGTGAAYEVGGRVVIVIDQSGY